MSLALAMIVGGLLGLLVGAHALIKGAAGLARRWGMSPLVVGLTVVAGGTSSQELFVVTEAALAGRDGISLGNVLGANCLNIGLILGLTAMVRPLRAHLQLIRFDVPIMILATLVVAAFVTDGDLDRLKGAVLLAALAGYLAFTVYMARCERSERVQNFQPSGCAWPRGSDRSDRRGRRAAGGDWGRGRAGGVEPARDVARTGREPRRRRTADRGLCCLFDDRLARLSRVGPVRAMSWRRADRIAPVSQPFPLREGGRTGASALVSRVSGT